MAYTRVDHVVLKAPGTVLNGPNLLIGEGFYESTYR